MESERFVTYKWLIGSTLSTLGITVAILGLFYGMFSKALDSKVDTQYYNARHGDLCSDIDSIKISVGEIAKKQIEMDKNLFLVLRAMKIEPFK